MRKALSDKIINRILEYHHDAKPALRYSNLYQLAVSVVLSAQTTDVQVNRVTPRLFRTFPDFKSLSMAKLSTVQSIIRSTGFYRNKSKNIISMSKKVLSDHGGILPKSLEELTGLPGVGRKSANVILAMGYGIPALAVDTHVIRVANRLGYVDSENPLEVEKSLTSMIPEDRWISIHLALINHGRKICTARKPGCPDCPVIALCVNAGRFL
ncbi:MAG: endonuclease III [Spirochaetes bacterium]|jgi:endonuclease-3|nr:endonuclease III [Spirochaetota bacterium]